MWVHIIHGSTLYTARYGSSCLEGPGTQTPFFKCRVIVTLTALQRLKEVWELKIKSTAAADSGCVRASLTSREVWERGWGGCCVVSAELGQPHLYLVFGLGLLREWGTGGKVLWEGSQTGSWETVQKP